MIPTPSQQECNMKKIMIQLKNKKIFFTHMKNLPTLVEFAKTFNATIAVVNVDADVLELEDLAVAFCNPNFKSSDEPYDVIQTLYPSTTKTGRTRSQILQDAKNIKQKIRDLFLAEKAITLKKIKLQFEKSKLTDACLSTHFSNVRKQLSQEGYSIVKFGLGHYGIN